MNYKFIHIDDVQDMPSYDRDTAINDWLKACGFNPKKTAAGQFKILDCEKMGVMFYLSSLKIMAQQRGKSPKVKECADLEDVFKFLLFCINFEKASLK